jgi:hypothetical protein
MLKSVLAGAALALAVATPVHADEQLPANVTNDLRCLVVGFNLAAAPDNPQVSDSAKLLAIYYLGRLHGEAPTLNLDDASYAVAASLTQQSFDTERQRCGTDFTTVGQNLITMAQHMSERSQHEQPHQ